MNTMSIIGAVLAAGLVGLAGPAVAKGGHGGGGHHSHMGSTGGSYGTHSGLGSSRGTSNAGQATSPQPAAMPSVPPPANLVRPMPQGEGG